MLRFAFRKNIWCMFLCAFIFLSQAYTKAYAGDPYYPFDTYHFILFAHGMGDNKGCWNRFAGAAEQKGYVVLRTNVDGCGYIKDRATQLANYINKYFKNNFSYLKDYQINMKAVGHSMGGLDLRYIVGEAYYKHAPFLQAARKFGKVYTIATPHQGHMFAHGDVGNCQNSHARHDLSDSHMAKFNSKYPYSKFKVDNTPMAFLAFTFQCWSCGGNNDCVVGTGNQSWHGAPLYSPPGKCYDVGPFHHCIGGGSLSGKHSNDLLWGKGGSGCTAELDNVKEVLNTIMDDIDYGYSRVIDRVIDNSYVRLINLLSNKAIYVSSISQTEGARIEQWDPKIVSPAGNIFKIVPAERRPYYYLVASCSGLCLEVKGASTAYGTKLIQAKCRRGKTNQQFWFHGVGNDLYEIRVRHGNKCVEMEKMSKDNGAPIQICNCAKVAQQYWRVKRVNERVVKIRSRWSGRVFDVDAAGTKNGTRIQVWDDVNVANQWFILVKSKDKKGVYYKIIDESSHKCLDVVGGRLNRGTQIQIWDCVNVENQKFLIQPSNRRGYYYIKPRYTSYCLRAGNNNGDKVHQYPCKGWSSQQWKIELRPEYFRP